MLTPPEKPKFVQNITWRQKILAGISGSLFLMAVITLVPWVINSFFSPFLYQLSILRACLAAGSLISGGFVGIPQIKNMIEWLFDFWGYYKQITEMKKDKDKEK